MMKNLTCFELRWMIILLRVSGGHVRPRITNCEIQSGSKLIYRRGLIMISTSAWHFRADPFRFFGLVAFVLLHRGVEDAGDGEWRQGTG